MRTVGAILFSLCYILIRKKKVNGIGKGTWSCSEEDGAPVERGPARRRSPES